MSSDVRIVDFDPEALVKLVDLVHHSLVAYMNSGVLTVIITYHPTQNDQMDVTVEATAPYSVTRGGRVLIKNDTSALVTVAIDESTVFGITTLSIPAYASVMLIVSSGAADGTPFHMSVESGGSGGTSQPITVRPPVVNN